VLRAYHNTFLRDTPVFRNYFLFGLGAQGLRQNERDVFNNVFIQTNLIPGTTIHGKEAQQLREGGNLLWGIQEGPEFTGDYFGKFRSSPLFELSRTVYQPGWTTHDHVADPQFVNVSNDLRLQPSSPAVDSGQSLPSDWPDPLRSSDKNQPDIGAVPLNATPWRIGIDGRMSLFGGEESDD